ncbi:MAG: DDE-type integrase/transposase/recombinase [Planctomycetes bacterium]|nr:DDE-type integrase/transposase/recombinase [Planctomycetota bacterium]MCO5167804.1 DDE-type integrase/transposase/recombinase [Planctomycetota bacterium]
MTKRTPRSDSPEPEGPDPDELRTNDPQEDVQDLAEAGDDEAVVLLDEDEAPESRPRLAGTPKGGSFKKPRSKGRTQLMRPRTLTAEQRLLILDSWQRSKLPGADFAPLVGVTSSALYKWKRLFADHGPAGLEDRPRGAPIGSRMSEVTRRAVLLLKAAHPDWGQERIHHELLRTKGLQASPGAIGKVLAEEGYEVVAAPTRPHPDVVRRFERARSNQLWQTDLFTFVLKRQNRRVHLVAFMDDHSRFLVGFGLHATASGALVREVLEAAIASHGAPAEVLTDNGAQYVTWRGKSEFTRLCEKRGIKHLVAKPRRPQTLGKCERFWGTLWRECLEAAVFLDLQDARLRIGHFVDHYNFHRTHQGIGGLVPADRFFGATPEVKATLTARVAKNALELARDGVPRKDFYLTGRVGDVGISLHAEGEQVVLTRDDGTRETVDLTATGRRAETGDAQALPLPVSTGVTLPTLPGTDDGDDGASTPPGASPLDGALDALEAAFADDDVAPVEELDDLPDDVTSAGDLDDEVTS